MSSPQLAGSIDVRFARTAIDRDQIFQLRHRVLRNNSRTELAGLMESNSRLIESADCGADLLGAFDQQGRALASLRRETIDSMSAGGKLPQVFRELTEKLAVNPALTTVSSRFIIDPGSPGGNLALRLFACMLRVGVQEGLSHDFCCCDQRKFQWRLKLGYRKSGFFMQVGGMRQEILTLPISRVENNSRPVVRLVRSSVVAA